MPANENIDVSAIWPLPPIRSCNFDVVHAVRTDKGEENGFEVLINAGHLCSRNPTGEFIEVFYANCHVFGHEIGVFSQVIYGLYAQIVELLGLL